MAFRRVLSGACQEREQRKLPSLVGRIMAEAVVRPDRKQADVKYSVKVHDRAARNMANTSSCVDRCSNQNRP